MFLSLGVLGKYVIRSGLFLKHRINSEDNRAIPLSFVMSDLGEVDYCSIYDREMFHLPEYV